MFKQSFTTGAEFPVANDALLGTRENQDTWPLWLSRHASHYCCTPAKEGLKSAAGYIKEHPYYAVLSLLTSLPGGINAFCMYAGIKPAELLSKIGEMSPAYIAFYVINAIVSIAVNTSMNANFLPSAKDKLVANLKEISSISGLSLNAVYFIAGMSALLASGALGYGAFAAVNGAAGITMGSSFGILNGLIAFATRYTGLPSLILRVKDIFDPKMQLKHDAVDKIKFLKQEFLDQLFLDQLDTALNNPNLKTDDKVIYELLKIINTLPADASEKTRRDYIKEKLGILFDTVFALTGALFIATNFTESGYHGAKILSQNAEKLTALNRYFKILIGALPGFVSGIFYFNHIFDLRRVSVETYEHLKEHPEEITSTVFWQLLCLISGNSVANVAYNIVTAGPNKPDDNIFHFPNNEFKYVYTAVNYAAASAVNSKVIQVNHFPKPTEAFPPPVLRIMDDDNDADVKRTSLEKASSKFSYACIFNSLSCCGSIKEPPPDRTIRTKAQAIKYLQKHRFASEAGLAEKLVTNLSMFSDYKPKIKVPATNTGNNNSPSLMHPSVSNADLTNPFPNFSSSGHTHNN